MKGQNNFIKSGIVYTILGFLPTASRFVLFPLFLHYLSPEDFALISLNTMVASILPTFITLGLETSINRFYFDFVKYPKIERVFVSTLIISIACTALVIGAIFVGVGPKLFLISFKTQRFSFYPFGISALLTAIPTGLYSLYLNYLRCRKDLQNYVILNLGLFLFSSLGEVIGIIFLKMPVEHLIWIKPLVLWPFLIVATIAILWKTGIHFERRLLRIAMSYSTPLLPHLIFGMVFIYTDRIMIENNLNLTYLAIYNLTMAISNIIDIFEQALRNATFPNIYKLLKEDVTANVDAISRIHSMNGLLLLTIMAGVAIMVPIGDYYFLKPVYRPLIYLIPFALNISVIRFFYIVYAEPLFFFKKVKHVSTSTFLQGVFSILFNFLLIPRFGLMGAITANIISKCIQVIFIYYTSISIKIFSYRVGFILTCMFIMMVILLGLTFSSRFLMDSRQIVHILASVPLIFVSFAFVYFVRKNNISIKQLW
jgi:O-antigen/teichoic acid export membrane protein